MDEPNPFLRWAMYHFAGGDAFVWGLVGFAVCQFAQTRIQTRSGRRWLTIGARLGLVWAIAVLPPTPLPLLAALVGMMGVWVWNQWRNRSVAAEAADGPVPRRERLLRLSMAGLALAMAGAEVSHFQSPSRLPTVAVLSVVGDSITAGLNDGEDTWPQKLSRQTGIQVRDASQPGATLKSALGQVELLAPLASDLLILEIGGNDLLEGLPVDEFDRNLDHLLQACTKTGRPTVMFELPLPPLATRYGASQRRQAQRYQVPLIPRRKFLSVLTAKGATVDGIHLSDAGQSRMAQIAQNLLNLPPSPTSNSGDYRHLEPVQKRAP